MTMTEAAGTVSGTPRHPSSVDVTHMTVGRLLHLRVRDSGPVEFFVGNDEAITYAEAEERSRHLARGMLSAGIGRGSRVALLLPMGVPFIAAWLAVARIGAVTVPVSTFSTPEELRGLIAGCDATLLLSLTTYRGHDYVQELEAAVPGLDLSLGRACLSPAVPSLRHVYVMGDDPRVHPGHSLRRLVTDGAGVTDTLLAAVEEDVGPEDWMVIFHTSGSTAAPKGVVHSHGYFLQHDEDLNQLRGLTAGKKLFTNSPVFWIGGLGFNIIGSLLAGSTLVSPTSTDPAEALDLLEKERPELVNGFEQSVAKLVAHPSFAGRDLSFIRSGNLFTLMASGIRPADPELRHSLFGHYGDRRGVPDGGR